jgi:hypothetical protein
LTIFYEELKIPVLLNKSFNYILPMKNSCDSKGRLSQQANRHSANQLEVVSKPQIRFKGKAQADRESRCSQHTWVCEHLLEACNAAIGP